MSLLCTGCCSWQFRRTRELQQSSTVTRTVTFPVFTGLCSCHLETDVDVSDYSAIRTALDNDLILEKIFSFANFQTLKNCRGVRRKWRDCANREIYMRNCSRVFINPKNLSEMLTSFKKSAKNNSNFIFFPCSEFVIENVEDSKSWQRLGQLFNLFFPGSDQESRINGEKYQVKDFCVKSLTVTWPDFPKDLTGLSTTTIKAIVRIIGLVKFSLEELCLSAFIMQCQVSIDNVTKVKDNPRIDSNNTSFDELLFPALKRLVVLPCKQGKAEFIDEITQQSPTMLSIGQWIVQNCPNLEIFENFETCENDSFWPKPEEIQRIKKYSFNWGEVKILEVFSTALNLNRVMGSKIEILSDSRQLFPKSIIGDDVYREENILQISLRIFAKCHHSLKNLNIWDGLPFYFPPADLPPFLNLQRLQVKISLEKNLDFYFSERHLLENPDGTTLQDSMPNLKTIALIVSIDGCNGVSHFVDFDFLNNLKSVQNLEIRPEILGTASDRRWEAEFSPDWLIRLHRLFPNIENVEVWDAFELNEVIPKFLGSGSKFSPLLKFKLNVHLGHYKSYPRFETWLKQLILPSHSAQCLIGLQSLWIVFEDYFYIPKDLARPLLSPEVLQLFVRPLPDLEVTFQFNQNQSPKELLSWLDPLVYASSKVKLEHLPREPFSKWVEAGSRDNEDQLDLERRPLWRQVLPGIPSRLNHFHRSGRHSRARFIGTF